MREYGSRLTLKPDRPLGDLDRPLETDVAGGLFFASSQNQF